LRREDVIPVIPRDVVVAFVEVLFTAVSLWNEESAVVDVATIAATTGVLDDTRLPDASVVTTMFAPIPESLKFVAVRFVVKMFVDVAFVVVPFVTVRAEMVDDAFEMKPWSVGRIENTTLPAVPVSSVRREASSDEVSIDVLDTLLLNTVQSPAVKHPNTPAVAVLHVRAPPTFERPEPVRSVKYSLFNPRVLAYDVVDVAFVVVLFPVIRTFAGKT